MMGPDTASKSRYEIGRQTFDYTGVTLDSADLRDQDGIVMLDERGRVSRAKMSKILIRGRPPRSPARCN